MGIRVSCPNCGRSLNVKSFLAGKRGVCPDCQTRFDIPAAGGERTESDDTPPAATTRPSNPLPAPAAVVPTSPLPAAMPPIAQPVASAVPGVAAAGDPIAEAPSAVWYVQAASGGQFGPASGEVLRQWLQQGNVLADSLVWREGWSDWQRADTLFAFPGGTPQPPTAAVDTVLPTATLVDTAAAPAVPELPVIEDPLATSVTARTTSRRRYKRRDRTQVVALILLTIIVLVLIPALVYVLMYQ